MNNGRLSHLLLSLTLTNSILCNPIRIDEPTIHDVIQTRYPYIIAVYGADTHSSSNMHELYSREDYVILRDILKHVEPVKSEKDSYWKAAFLAAGITGGVGVVIACGMVYWMTK